MKHIRSAEIIIAASVAAGLVLFLVLGVAGGFAGGDPWAWVNYYGHTFAGSFSNFFYATILFLCLVVILLVIWSLGGGFVAVFFPKLRMRGVRGAISGNPREIFFVAAKRSREMLLIVPAILFVTVIALAMGEANEFARARLQDYIVVGWEHAVFGNYVFAALGSIHYPHWLISFVIISFENMSLILVGAGIILAYIALNRFREMLVAFCIGILAMVPMWLILPVLSPQDRYINNVYGLPPASPQLALAVQSYHPQPELADFLSSTRAGKKGLPALPTSTIPSAHVFWAVIAGYYLFRAKRWLGWVALPFLVASTFGTVLLAQHYFMDVPAGIAIAVFAIFLAHNIENTGELSPVARFSTSVVSHEMPDEPRGAVYS